MERVLLLMIMMALVANAATTLLCLAVMHQFEGTSKKGLLFYGLMTGFTTLTLLLIFIIY